MASYCIRCSRCSISGTAERPEAASRALRPVRETGTGSRDRNKGRNRIGGRESGCLTDYRTSCAEVHDGNTALLLPFKWFRIVSA